MTATFVTQNDCDLIAPALICVDELRKKYSGSYYKFIQSGMTLTISMPDILGQVWIESVLDEDDIDCIGPALLGAEVILDMGEPLIPLPLQEPEPVPVPEPVPELTVEEQRRIAREARLRRFG
jgi:hypothetical protein